MLVNFDDIVGALLILSFSGAYQGELMGWSKAELLLP